MRYGFLASTMILATAGSLAQPSPSPSQSISVEVVLADFSFTPSSLSFQRDRRYRLHLVNRGSGGHNFSGKEFFAAVKIDPSDQAMVVNGKVEVAEGASADIGFTAATPGTYKIRCTHFLHSGFGMKGTATIS